MKQFLIAIIFLISIPGAIHGEPQVRFKEKEATKELLVQLRSGGFVLYMRHGTSDNRIPDRVPHVDLNDCSTQRPLTEKGRKVSAFVGKSIRMAGIPVTDVVSSPLCRAKETAHAAFGSNFQILQQLMSTSNMTSEEKKPNLEALRRLLSEPVAAGGNRIIVGHAPNLADLIGYFPKPEGTIAVFMPQGKSGFEYVASIHPDSWNQLLKP